mgnify:CR=1 FL=1
MDTFHEESVSKINTGINTFIYIASFLGMILCGFLTLVYFSNIVNKNSIHFPSIVYTILFGLATFGFYVLRNHQRIEYDYTFTNGILDVAKIINNNKRKKMLTADIREFEIIAPISDEGFQRALANRDIKKKYHFFLNRGGGLYYGIFNHEGVKSLIVFEPSQELLKLFKLYNSRNVKI